MNNWLEHVKKMIDRLKNSAINNPGTYADTDKGGQKYLGQKTAEKNWHLNFSIWHLQGKLLPV